MRLAILATGSTAGLLVVCCWRRSVYSQSLDRYCQTAQAKNSKQRKIKPNKTTLGSGFTSVASCTTLGQETRCGKFCNALDRANTEIVAWINARNDEYLNNRHATRLISTAFIHCYTN